MKITTPDGEFNYEIDKITIDLNMSETISIIFKVYKGEDYKCNYAMELSGSDFTGIMDSIKGKVDTALLKRFDQTILDENVRKLWVAENNYISFMRSLGLADNASREDIQGLCTTLEANGQALEAMKIGLQSLALINDVTQCGGKWADITWHDNI